MNQKEAAYYAKHYHKQYKYFRDLSGSLGDCNTAAPQPPAQEEKAMQVAKANANLVMQQPDTVGDQRYYLKNRARDVFTNKRHAARMKFGIEDMDSPRTPDELVQRIKDGMYIIDGDRAKDCVWAGPIHAFRWRDPAVVEDQAGYRAWEAAADKTFQGLKDAIVIHDPAEGLKALWDYESAE